ncbi:Ankyrin repeat and zinc finger domain-containing protein 1 [Paragonimus heterotremus]|uniref:Ankyrin repeat and zinc finger domain-containing protein 1 n=1 Tax=Paragonimus heterotremus TaxID=100268 RepID=A0A8J4WHU6_9TREM|nr:Ankyrin repeat and zinc finger domain-containing protein 1 [Paragonimus heterotremus]
MSSKAGIIDRQCKRTCDRFCLFDQKIAVEKLTGLTLLAETINNTAHNQASPTRTDLTCSNYVSVQDKFVCQTCNVDLLDTQTMREHFKGDWHLCNVNRGLTRQEPFSAEQYKEYLETSNTELHRPVGSATTSVEDQSATEPPLSASSHKQMIYFRNKCGEIIGINRCILFTRKRLPTNLDDLLSCVTRVRQSRRWAVLLYSGGKFAGGIFDGLNEVAHKTLHRYTVRAKQGGGQTTYDATNSAMGAAKSAGANLRRHGEIAIRNDISHLLHNVWRRHLQACQFIFLWSPKAHRNIFFNPPSTSLDTPSSDIAVTTNGSATCSPLLTPAEPDPLATPACQLKLGMVADDLRVYRIPCRTKHITYAQVREIHKELSTFDVYDSHANLGFLTQSRRKQFRSLSESGEDTLLETKSGRFIYGPLSMLSPKSTKVHLSDQNDTSDTEDENDDLETETCSLSSSLEELAPAVADKLNCSSSTDIPIGEPVDSFTTSVSDARSNSGARAKDTITPSKDQEDIYATYQNWHRRLRVAVASGDYLVLRSLLPDHYRVTGPPTEDSLVATAPSHFQSNSEIPNSIESEATSFCSEGSLPPVDVCLRLLNHPLGEGRTTLLHFAVEFQSDTNVLNLLLECGCNPALQNVEGITPYMLACRLRKKTLTQVFRRFRFSHPTQYDYDKAQIPAPLDPAQELAKAERERERLRKQRQRAKENKAAERAQLEKQRQEAAEQERFRALSDREKRALVAERRILASKATPGVGENTQVFSRCFQCACDISGKVPFTYLDFNFCTPACLRAHRLSSSGKPAAS